MELNLEKWSGAVSTVSIGATKEEGGTRCRIKGRRSKDPALFI